MDKDDLFKACRDNDTMAVERLLARADVDINAPDDKGWTPLLMATHYERDDIVKLLLSAGADVEACDSRGRTALLIATHYARGSIVNRLLEAGSNIQALDNDTRGALHHAAHSGDARLVQLFIDKGIDLNAPDSLDMTPIAVAICSAKFDAARLLAASGADLSRGMTRFASDTVRRELETIAQCSDLKRRSTRASEASDESVVGL